MTIPQGLGWRVEDHHPFCNLAWECPPEGCRMCSGLQREFSDPKKSLADQVREKWPGNRVVTLDD